MSFTAYAIQYVGPVGEHWDIKAYHDVTKVDWDKNPDGTENRKGVTLWNNPSVGRHLNSPFPITVTRWAALIPLYLTKP